MLYLLLGLFIFSACKKEDKEEETPFSGQIAITFPDSGTGIVGGTSFPVTATISGNKEMHGYVLTIYNTNNQTVVYTTQNTNHATSYTINETVTHNLTMATPLKLVIEVEVDHDGETLKKEILFSYQP